MDQEDYSQRSAEEELAELGYFSPSCLADSDSVADAAAVDKPLEQEESFAQPEDIPAVQLAENSRPDPEQPLHSRPPESEAPSQERAAAVEAKTKAEEAEPEPAGESIRDRAVSLIDHLADLRKRLVYTLTAFVIFLILSMVFVNRIFLFLIRPLGAKPTVLSPGEIVHVYFMIGGLAALAPTLPFAMWQLWLFVSPGLTARERRISSTYIPLVLLVFLAGISFGYFLVFPRLMYFLTKFSTQYTNFMPTADAYLSFMVRLVVPFGFIFEMPLVVMFLTRLGFVNPVRLAKFRKYAYFIIVCISFMLTPPEITSHLSLTAPMILLYEVSIQFSKAAYRKRQRMLQKQDSQFA